MNSSNENSLKLKKTDDKTKTSQASKELEYNNIGSCFTLYFLKQFVLASKNILNDKYRIFFK